MNSPGAEFVELFLQESSEHLQFLREYSGVLLDPYPAAEEVERLHLAAHTLKGSSAMYGYPLFSEVSAKLAHIFQYAMNLGIGQEAAAPLVEFISEAVAVLESDLLVIHDGGAETVEEITAFKQKYPFAFQTAEAAAESAAEATPAAAPEPAATAAAGAPAVPVAPKPKVSPPRPERPIILPEEGDLDPEILEFFVPEVEEHLQAATECLLALEANPNAEDIHRLFRAMHTVKGAAAQVGLPRISMVAHRAEDLIGRLRDGDLRPSAEIVDLCLEAVDALKKFLYRQWPSEAELQRSVKALLGRIARLAPETDEEEVGSSLPSSEPELPPEQAKIGLAGDLGAAPQVAEPSFFHLLDEDEDLLEVQVPPLRPAQDSLSAQDRGGIVGYPKHPTEELAADQLLESDVLAEALPAAEPFPDHATIGHDGGPVEQVAAPAPAPAVPSATVDLVAQAVTEAATTQASNVQIPEVQVPEVQTAEYDTAPATLAAAPAPAGPTVPVAAVKTGLPPSTAPVMEEGAEVKRAASVPPAKSVRIGLERLDRMMNAVGELVINRTRMLGRMEELEKLADVLNFSKARMSDKLVEFQDKYEFSRLHSQTNGAGAAGHWEPAPGYSPGMSGGGFGQARPVTPFPFRGGYSSYSHSFDASLAEFSELEMDRYDDFNILSRSLTEISADITEILTQLDGFVRRVDSDIDEFTKLAHNLQDEITQARMVSIGNLYTRISRTVRDAAKAAGKQVELELSGADTELDNNIIQQIADPLLHLVRNAVAHGIEREQERYQSGKADHGKVAVRAYHRGNHIYIEVEDDGRGIDWENVRSAALNLGLVSSEDGARLTERQLQEMLFHPGFSTAPRKSELAGRGVGLDVVRTNIEALNGEIEIETRRGCGTRFTLKVPLTLIISQALFVRAARQTFALPLAFVEEIRRVRHDEIERIGDKQLTKVRDVVTEVVRLDAQLGLHPDLPKAGGSEATPAAGPYSLVVLVNVAGRPVGIIVDEVLHKDEIVIKNLGEYLRNVKLFPGATIAPDGSLILLVDVSRLIAGEAIERRPLMTSANAATARIFAPGALAAALGEIPEGAIDRLTEEKVVVLADDSISVRKFVGRMLEKAGYRVRLAADGLEALEIVAQMKCDLVVTDLEMPRTNGYELLAHLRQNPETRNIPVMVVTSRAGAKHRDKAMKQGAVQFLVKPVQEEQFIAVVNGLIGPGAGTQRPKTAVV